uniref:Uncharacterized protein n=1 Tax=Amphiprion percula TaxID=161767 RepID=A0A3P8U2H0_AMPPE
MIPFSIVDLSQQVQVPIQHLNGKKIHLCSWVFALLLSGFAMTEKHQPIWLCSPEVKRDGSCLLRRPLAQCHKRLRRIEGDGVQRCYTLALKGHHPTYLGQMQDKTCLEVSKRIRLLNCCSEYQDQNGSFVVWQGNKASSQL